MQFACDGVFFPLGRKVSSSKSKTRLASRCSRHAAGDGMSWQRQLSRFIMASLAWSFYLSGIVTRLQNDAKRVGCCTMGACRHCVHSQQQPQQRHWLYSHSLRPASSAPGRERAWLGAGWCNLHDGGELGDGKQETSCHGTTIWCGQAVSGLCSKNFISYGWPEPRSCTSFSPLLCPLQHSLLSHLVKGRSKAAAQALG